MKITREAFKNIVREVMTEESEYQQFFQKALEKTGKSIPDMSDEEKKAFFNKIDAAWQGKGEKNEELVGNQHKLDVDGDGEIEASDLAALRAGNKTDEASTSSAPGEWVAYLSMTRGKKLLKTFNSARGAKQFLSQNAGKLLGGSNVESVGIMTKKEWDEREAKYAIEGVNEAGVPAIIKGISPKLLKVGEKITINTDGKKKEYKVVKYNSNGDCVLHPVNESVNEASKPTIKVVTKLKNEQGIQIVVVKTTKGETEYGGFVVRGKLQKVIPVGANKTKEDVKKRALQIWDEFGKQLGETVNEGIWPKSKLPQSFQFALAPELKKNFKGIFYSVGNDIYHNDKKVLSVDNDRDSVNSIIKQLKSKIKESVTEGKLGDTWRKNNKKGFVLKVGNIELKSAGPTNSHDILVNREPWGSFMMDYEAGGNDWWVKPTRGKDFWVDSIDDLVKKIKADSRFNESVSEAKYPTDLKIGSVVMGQGFTRLKGIDGGKYYKIVAMDDTTATLVPSDKSGNVKGSSKVRHKLDSIEGGIKTAKRGDENGIVVIKESVNEASGFVKNPKTGKDIKISTALSYGKEHPAYKAAAAASQQAKPVGTPPGVKPKPPVNAKPAMGTKVVSPAPTNAKPAMGTKVQSAPPRNAQPPVGTKVQSAPPTNAQPPVGTKVTSAPPRNAQPPVGTKVTGPPPGVKAKPPIVKLPSATKAPLGPPPGVKAKPPIVAPPTSGKPSLGPPPGVKAKPPVIAPPSAKPAGTPPGVKAKPPIVKLPNTVKPSGAVPPPPPPPPSGKPAGTPPGVRPKGVVPPPPPPPPPIPPKKSKFEDKNSVEEKKKIKK